MHRRVLFAIAFGAFPAVARARVRGRHLEDTLADSEWVVIATVQDLEKVDRMTIARLEVTEVLKGDLDAKAIPVLAGIEGPTDVRARAVKEATGLDLFVDVFWGRGKLTFEDETTVRVVRDGVFVRTPGVLDERTRRLALEDLRAMLR